MILLYVFLKFLREENSKFLYMNGSSKIKCQDIGEKVLIYLSYR